VFFRVKLEIVELDSEKELFTVLHVDAVLRLDAQAPPPPAPLRAKAIRASFCSESARAVRASI
jgi:hypothetical protein